MMFFPDSAHGVASPSMQRLRWSFLQRALEATPDGAPADADAAANTDANADAVGATSR
jgi:hypothetical protein